MQIRIEINEKETKMQWNGPRKPSTSYLGRLTESTNLHQTQEKAEPKKARMRETRTKPQRCAGLRENTDTSHSRNVGRNAHILEKDG